jgi:hypothetical protein
MIGKKIGKILVLREVKTGKPGKYYAGQCECGLVKIWYSSNLKNGTATQCRNCAGREHSKSFDDPTMIDRQFGKLIVLSAAGSDKRGKLFATQCTCGDIKIRPGTLLKTGRATQCEACARKRRFNTIDEPAAIGRKFGKILVVKTVEPGIQGKKRYECLCDCGETLTVYENNLKRSKVVQCKNCAGKKISEKHNDPTIIGRKFGQLLVLKAAGSNSRRLKIYDCRCECGNTITVTGRKLKTGNAIQCTKCTRSGWSNHPLYDTWKGILRRCNDHECRSFRNYGGRGIQVCKQWESSFENFCNDMDPKPDGLHIDRIDNDGNYEPNNCRWVTPKENNSNRRCSPKNRDKYITIKKDNLCSSCLSNYDGNNYSVAAAKITKSLNEQLVNKNDLRLRTSGHIKNMHGLRHTVMYRIWSGMRARCNNPKLKSYRNYGGRGIEVCVRWNNFNLFCADMGERPSNMTLDRVDPDGNYEPGNCRWIARQENNNNQRRSIKNRDKYLTIRKDRLCIACQSKFIFR